MLTSPLADPSIRTAETIDGEIVYLFDDVNRAAGTPPPPPDVIDPYTGDWSPESEFFRLPDLLPADVEAEGGHVFVVQLNALGLFYSGTSDAAAEFRKAVDAQAGGPLPGPDRDPARLAALAAFLVAADALPPPTYPWKALATRANARRLWDSEFRFEPAGTAGRLRMTEWWWCLEDVMELADARDETLVKLAIACSPGRACNMLVEIDGRAFPLRMVDNAAFYALMAWGASPLARHYQGWLYGTLMSQVALSENWPPEFTSACLPRFLQRVRKAVSAEGREIEAIEGGGPSPDAR